MHKNNTFKGRSDISLLSSFGCRLAATEFRGQRRANFRATLAAVLQEKVHQFSKSGDVGMVMHHAAFFPDTDERSLRHDREMRRHCVVRCFAETGNFACRQLLGKAIDQSAKDLKPRRLSESGQRGNSDLFIHMSGFINMIPSCQYVETSRQNRAGVETLARKSEMLVRIRHA